MKKFKPQVLLKIEDPEGNIHFVKKWEKGFSIEGHTSITALTHNSTTPQYFFPISEDYVAQLFKDNGKEYIR